MNKDLTSAQNDYAVFLPALSGFYATFVGKQRFREYVDNNRIPTSFSHGVESLNYLNPEQGQFYYKWTLYSAGHANLDLNKPDESEDMIRNRDRTTSFCLGDSGGFQIGKGVWPADWKNPNCPRAQKKREQVLTWMDTLMDYGMCLDIPAWVARSDAGRAATGINSYEDAVAGTNINNEYFINNRNGNCKFLNVLQGETHADAEDWYQRMKKYCDRKIYGDRAFNGWAMGGQNMCDVHLVLKRLVSLRYDGMLETGQHDWMHFLGTSKLEWALLLTDIQRAVRKYHNPNFTISFDCASPFLATANGQIYTRTEIVDREKWVYRMLPSIDDKKYYQDNRLFKDAVIADGHFKEFTDSPMMKDVLIRNICIYGPTCVNKLGKVGKTSWDSFSYAIMMGHNIWMHINSVQEANRQYDNGLTPNMLVASKIDGKYLTQYAHNYFKEIIDAIFSAPTRAEAERVIDDYTRYWMSVPGTRGATGKRTVNAKTYFSNLFEEVDEPTENNVLSTEEINESDTDLLDALEDQIKHDQL